MNYLPKLHQLRVFQEVIRCGSIRAASRALNQSQPALTRTIKELEQVLGTALITRGTRGVTLTESGRAFSVRMQLILQELQRATDEIKQINEHTQGNVSMGFSSLIGLTIFPDVVDEFRKRLPQATLHVKEGQLSTLLPDLREGRLDFAIGTISSEVPLSEFIEEPLFSASFGVLCRKDHPLANCTSMEQLRDAKWYIPDTDMGYYKHIGKTLAPIYRNLPQFPVLSDSIICGLNLLIKSDHLAVLAVAMANPLNLNHQLTILPLETPLPKATYSLVYSRKWPLTMTAQRMINIIRWHCRNFDWHNPQ
jgi:LysR family tdc operon transcriptional activator